MYMCHTGKHVGRKRLKHDENERAEMMVTRKLLLGKNCRSFLPGVTQELH